MSRNTNHGAGFIKLSRNPEVDELMHYPIAFVLLTQTARRAVRADQRFNPHNLALGQALIGDHQSIGASEQEYRTAKAQLEKWGFATFHPTNKGTIATLSDTRVFDINIERTNGLGNDQNNSSTTFHATNAATTNKEEKKVKKSEEENNTALSANVPPGYSERAGAVIELWNGSIVSAGLGFEPVTKFGARTEEKAAGYEPHEAEDLFARIVKGQQASPIKRRMTLFRVLQDIDDQTGWIEHLCNEAPAPSPGANQ